MTPICLMPSNALGSSGKRWRPPATMVSSRSAILTVRVWKTFEEKLIGPNLYCWCWKLRRPLWRAKGPLPRAIHLEVYNTATVSILKNNDYHGSI